MSATLTVDQITKDTITQISYRYWSPLDENQKLEPFEANLIEDIYTNELLNSRFAVRRIMLLEFSQYLENYLWKYFDPKKTTKAHLISIVVMINEKFRERIPAWECFKTKSEEFAQFFHNVMLLCVEKFENHKLNHQEHTILLKFLDNCVNSLEHDLVRLQIQKVCSLPMWTSLCDNRREYELSKLAKLKKFWKAIEKSDAKLSESDRERVQFERTFLRSLIKRFLDVLKSDESEELESGEIHDKKASKLNYLECFLELIIDLEALLPTRRFFNTLLEDTNLIIECDLWIQETKKKINDDLVFTGRYYLFMQLLDRVKFYNKFEIDEQTGEARDEHSRLDIHYAHLKSLQKGVFKYFRDDLITFALTNIACIDKRDELIKHLDGLTRERLYALAEHLHLVPYNSNQDSTTNGTNGSGKYSLDERMLLEIIIKHMELAPSQLDELNSMPLYPTETIVWDENLVPIDFKQTSFHDTCLALPKLNLQFLTLQDYLMRNFHLFRLESAYELRQDIEDAIMRLKPYFSLDEMQVCFGAWSRMAQPITNFTLVEVGEARVGEEAPSVVRANVTLDLEFLRQDVRTEWESLRRYDIGFLVTLRPEFNTPQQKFDPNDSFMRQMGIIAVRGCEIEGMLNNEGKLVDEAALRSGSKEAKDSLKFATSERSFRVILDANQYKLDMDNLKSNKINEDVYATFNVFVRRRPKENNFKAILESIRDLMNINFVVPSWLHDLLLGYGSPASATYYNLKEPKPTSALDFRDTFISREHLLKSFPGYEIDMSKAEEPPYKLKFLDLQGGDSNEKRIVVESHKVPNRGPYPQNQPKRNQVRFTPTQVEAIKSGMQPGLTLVVGPPGTGKTDVAVQIISNLYHNFPQQKCLIVTHSNQALNQLFDKLVLLDIDERHLLRLGHGEEELETEKDFSRYGRVDYVLAQRLKLLDQVDKLEQSLCLESGVNTAAYSCETAAHFFVNVVQPRWDLYLSKLSKIDSQTEKEKSEAVETLFPFAKFFEDAPQPLFNKEGSYANNLEVSKGCYRYIKLIFKQLEEFRAFELIRGGADRAEYLLVKEAKVIAMTCTHAALKRRDLVLSNFTYDSIIMEEAAQILEIETFIPLLLQNPDHNKQSRLKRWIMIGDHNQLPPVIKNMTFQKYSNMEQSLFTRFVKLQVPTIDLDAQGRCRPTLCELFKWRYKALGDLQHVLDQTEFKNANAGFRFDYQIIDVQDFNGQGESEPQPFYFQNLAEAEYAVAIYMYMRLLGYPSEKISILTTYNGQKHLIRDVLRKRTSNSDWMGQPHKITTVDKYQGQQNDFIILSLVRSKNVGHLRDVRRLIVALSRARLGLYILGRVNLFKSCFELTPAFNILLARRTTQLQLVMNEPYPAKRAIGDQVDKDRIRVIKDMPEMCQFAFDFYQHGGLVQKMETE